MATTDLNATSGPHLRGKYAVVGVGETGYVRGSGRTTRALGTEAVRKVMEDAGFTAADVDGVLSYRHNDSTPAPVIAGDLGIRPNFYMDVYGGGSSTEALVGIAMGVIEAGMCNTVAIYRAMNGYSQVRIGGTGGRGAVAPLGGDALFTRGYGLMSAGQMFCQSFMRHMYDYGTTPEQVAMVKVIHSEHASNNPKAYYRKRVTVEEVLASRMIVKPLHLLLLVELDIQRGVPGEFDGLRMTANLATPEGELAPPDLVRQVGIGTRVRIVYRDVGEGLAMPLFAIDETVEQPAPWRYPLE